jgi:hypothetical protein
VWLVWGRHGENFIRAEGRTRDEAWQNAEMQALGVGLLGRSVFAGNEVNTPP